MRCRCAAQNADMHAYLTARTALKARTVSYNPNLMGHDALSLDNAKGQMLPIIFRSSTGAYKIDGQSHWMVDFVVQEACWHKCCSGQYIRPWLTCFDETESDGMRLHSSLSLRKCRLTERKNLAACTERISPPAAPALAFDSFIRLETRKGRLGVRMLQPGSCTQCYRQITVRGVDCRRSYVPS
eukprot:6176007-Pleurochrysis_carterae.AAC.2